MVASFYACAPEHAPSNGYYFEVRAAANGDIEATVYHATRAGSGLIGISVGVGDWIVGTEYGIEALKHEVFESRFEVIDGVTWVMSNPSVNDAFRADPATGERPYNKSGSAAFWCATCQTVNGCGEHCVFKCATCGRATWWRDGGADDHPEDCSECWNAKHEHGAAATFATGKTVAP